MKTVLRLQVLAWLGLALGCQQALDELAWLTEAKGGESAPPSEPDPQGPRVLEESCQLEYETRAKDVLATYGACETDADCGLAQSSPGCLSNLSCSLAIQRGSDADFQRAALAVVSDYRSECGEYFCINSDCIDPSSMQAFCDTGAHQCSTRTRE